MAVTADPISPVPALKSSNLVTPPSSNVGLPTEPSSGGSSLRPIESSREGNGAGSRLIDSSRESNGSSSRPMDSAKEGNGVTEGDADATTRQRSGTIKKAASHESVQRLSASPAKELASPSKSLPVAVAAAAWRDFARDTTRRPGPGSRTVSTPPSTRCPAMDHRSPEAPAAAAPSLAVAAPPSAALPAPPPAPPLPPMSLPTHLQLELAAQPPSPLYIQQSRNHDIPYESHAVKLERLKNVMLIPPFLERTLYFGALACLDAWLHTFTILPIRFAAALVVLVRWWAYIMAKEVGWLVGFVWYGLGRVWRRGRSRSRSRAGDAPSSVKPTVGPGSGSASGSASTRSDPGPASGVVFRHGRTKATPSNLSTFHKADLLQGAVIVCSSAVLMRLDASRMYHLIRAQSAIKLYVVYNILEVGDRLLSALGQDILECLFSAETLSRNASGRSKVLLPAGMFALALAYSCLHSVALYIQVITLNVAVNSYSNALLTLLLSNQFVEIKSTVFKRFERDSLFQLTCADIVERFHMWVMLLIIGMRNIVEVGGLSVPGNIGHDGGAWDMSSSSPGDGAPLHPASILPHSFTVLPSWVMSGEVLSPFLIVVGSEMLVDTIKHAYVTKFNNIKPQFYSRILDVLCKDYYTNAFTTPSLTRRLGLAVIPLSCLFIRASIQTYHMLISAHVPMPYPPPQASLTADPAAPSSPAMMAALNRFDVLIRSSLGRATYGHTTPRPWYDWTSDDVIAALTMVVVFFIVFLALLIIKLLLGMLLLRYARDRYARMKTKEGLVAAGKADWESYKGQGKRAGGYGQVEVGEERSRWVNADPGEGPRRRKKEGGEYQGVFRFDMVEKRIW